MCKSQIYNIPSNGNDHFNFLKLANPTCILIPGHPVDTDTEKYICTLKYHSHEGRISTLLEPPYTLIVNTYNILNLKN